MSLTIYPCMLTQNDCYRAGRTITPKGIVVHSTGAANPYLRRYVQPDDGRLGKNPYDNHWNAPGLDVCVNAFIGLDRDEAVRCYQTLPWNMRPWGVGSGPKGSYNSTHIQFEICEDDHSSESYCRTCFETAAQLCAFLCRRYDIPVQSVVSHHEAYRAGYGSGHVDPDNWWPKFGLSMDALRARVSALLEKARPALAPARGKDPKKAGAYTVAPRVGLHLRTGPGTRAASLEILPQGTVVRCYGYFTEDWLYVAAPSGRTGYCHGAYLRRKAKI